MLKKTITYTNYNGVQVTEDFYFNLTKAEITEMEMSVDGGFAERIQKIVNAKNQPEIIKIFKKLILDSYGVKSDDGRRFIKNEQLKEDFSQTEAYSELFMELATNADEAAAFVNGIIPADVAAEASKVQNQQVAAPVSA